MTHSSPESLPFSQACENNKPWILQVLRRHFGAPGKGLARVLEIGGGTGQHAEFFAAQMPWLYWQSSDIAENVDALQLRLRAADLPNLPEAITLDAFDEHWSVPPVDFVFSANTLHIMSESAVQGLFRNLPAVLANNARVAIYGPFRYDGKFTTDSNAGFDKWLKQRDPQSGIRDAEWIDELAADAGLTLIEDNNMPANNQLRIWHKPAG